MAAKESNDQTGRSAVANVGERVQSILDNAQQAADEIHAGARTEAAEYLAERREEADRIIKERLDKLSELTESLSARAAGIEREASVLASEVADAIGRLSGGESAPASSGPSSAESGRDRDAQEQAVLRATQMAVDGSDRAEIERTLREQFGIDDPSELLDRAMGSKAA